MNEALEQVAYADRIILNKTDLVRGVGRVCRLGQMERLVGLEGLRAACRGTGIRVGV